MATSGDPRKRAKKPPKQSRPTPPPVDVSAGPTAASAWVSNVGGDDEDLPLPSGNIARVRRVGPEAFLAQGIMPDSITPIIEKAIKTKKGLRPQDQLNMAKDPKKLGAMVEMLDRTLEYAVVSPRVVMPPTCIHTDGDPEEICGKLNNAEHPDDDHAFTPGPRDPNVLYADRVDLEDKMFILNFVTGGSRDLERFRGEHGAGVASLSAVKGG